MNISGFEWCNSHSKRLNCCNSTTKLNEDIKTYKNLSYLYIIIIAIILMQAELYQLYQDKKLKQNIETQRKRKKDKRQYDIAACVFVDIVLFVVALWI